MTIKLFIFLGLQVTAELKKPTHHKEKNSLSEGSAQPPTVFISYAREDSTAAERLYDSLKGMGVEPLLDKEALLSGEDWRTSIRNAIKNSKYFIVLLSSISVNKRGYIQSELKYAMKALHELPESQIFVIFVIR